jgi:hypothetical protein
MLKQYGIIAGSLAGMFLILFGVMVLTAAVRERGLQNQTQAVLDRVFPGEYQVQSPDKDLRKRMKLPGVNATAFAFELHPRQGKPFEMRHLAVITPVSTMFGPFPGVFLVQDDLSITFVGFGLYAKSFDAADRVVRDSQISHFTATFAERLGGGK